MVVCYGRTGALLYPLAPHRYVIYHTGVRLARLHEPVLGSRYRLVDTTGRDLPAAIEGVVNIPTLGSGGFGAVVRAKDRLGLDRAIKILDPENVVSKRLDVYATQYYTGGRPASPEDARAIAERFQEEIKHTNARPFKNILPITDYDTFSDCDERLLSYYTSPYVEGDRLDNFVRSRFLAKRPLTSTEAGEFHDQLLALIDDLLAAIEELQDAGVILLPGLGRLRRDT